MRMFFYILYMKFIFIKSYELTILEITVYLQSRKIKAYI